jgi:hypothetical protein
MKITLKAQGLIGYIDGTISISLVILLPENIPVTPVPPTPVYSTNPSQDEWTFRNDRARGMIEVYVLDLPLLIPDVDKTNAIDSFFKTFQELQREAIEGGNDVSDKIFKSVVLAVFPTLSMDTIIQNITANPMTYPTSASVIQQITYQFSHTETCPDAAVSGNRLPQANAAPQTRIEHLEHQLAAVAVGGLGTRGNGNGKKCTNPNCLREGHLAEDCFRQGGGKEGCAIFDPSCKYRSLH